MLFFAQAATPPLALIPLPSSVRRDDGALSLGKGLAISGPKDEAETLVEALKADGVRVERGGRRVTLTLVPGMAEEGYRLKVSPDGATIEATTAAGLFYGGQTLRQMVVGFPRDPGRIGPGGRMIPGGQMIPGSASNVTSRWEIPCATIEDAPRFAWRGMMVDVSRHFRPVDDIERIIDLNARMKMNVFHWHLTDDGGWRMETKTYPELTRRGAWRSSPPKGKWNYQGITFPEKRRGDEYGGFYTKDDIKKVLAFAARRHVTIVPEIEMPGHEQAALQSLPWLKCDGIPEGQQAVALCAGKETTFEFVQKVLDETMALFPSKFIHIGGDEVDKRDWNRCPSCQARMQKEGLKNAEELQSYFIRRVDAYLSLKGRRLIGWDEILEGGLAPGATVMSWRGIAGGIAAAKQGRDVVMSPTSHLYLDYSYENIPTSRVYAYDPIPTELTPDEARHVLGAQGNVWTEWLPDEKDVERMAYPRAAALAEAVWTPLALKSWPDFSVRLGAMLSTYDQLGVNYHIDPPMLDHTAYLTDEKVRVTLPLARPGWGIAVGSGAKPDSIMAPQGGDAGYVDLAPGSEMRFSLIRLSDRATSPQVGVQVSAGGRRDSTAGLASGLTVVGKAGRFGKVGPFDGASLGTATAIDLALKPAPEAFALRFTGFIRLPKSGDYTFALSSDDGSVLKIGGLTIVDHDGEHSAAAKAGTVSAKAGVYPLELGYFDAGGANSLSLTVTPPDGVAGPIPAAWLWH